MKTQLTLLAMMVLLVVAAGIARAGTYSGGNGSSENPYKIATAEDMNEIGANPDDWDKHFVLTANIDLSGYTGTQFNIIGNLNNRFTGVFDGGDHSISNFTYTCTGTNYTGLFGCVDRNAEIKDLTLIEPNVHTGTGDYVGSLVGWLQSGMIIGCGVNGGSVSGEDYTGGLVGGNTWYGTISNCYATGAVSGNGWSTGGLMGYNNRGTISNCYATGVVSGGNYYTGGLVGRNSYGGNTISNCYATGAVSGGDYTGGLVGRNWESTISNCYATGEVSGDDDTGGLVGNSWGGTISNCYATGEVSGDDDTGGLVGYNNYGGPISNCYATGSVSGYYNTGGLVGYNWYGPISNCYATGSVSGGDYTGGLVGYNPYGTILASFWDIETSGQSTSDGGTGKTTAEMKQQATFTNWDFDTVWDIVEGVTYPYLRDTLNPALPVKGIDVSSWQENIDWSEVYDAGYRYAFARASWWYNGIDNCFVTNMENGHTAGMLMGAYHFAYPEYADAGSEARHFFNVAKDYLKEGYLMPALDIENDPDSGSYPYNLGPEGLSDWVNKWMDTVQALARQELHTEVEPMLYVNRTYANFLDEHLADVYDLWIAHPTCNPDGEPDTKKWNNWAFWQYYMPEPDGPCPDNSTGPNSVPGIDGTVDLDVFNGDMSSLQTFRISAWEPDFWILYHLCSPADMLVTDPDGLSISKEVNQIPRAAYVEIDINGDGDLDEEISIPYRKVGYYQITIVPEPNALPTDTYSLEAVIEGQTMVLAEDVQIQDIPPGPYEFESKLNRSDFDSDGDVDFADYAVLAIHWMNEDCNYPEWCEGTDLDYSGVVDFNDLDIFAENWLWGKIPADFDIDGDVDFVDYAFLASRWRYVDCNEPTWCFGADINKSGSVDLHDLAELAAHWLEGIAN